MSPIISKQNESMKFNSDKKKIKKKTVTAVMPLLITSVVCFLTGCAEFAQSVASDISDIYLDDYDKELSDRKKPVASGSSAPDSSGSLKTGISDEESADDYSISIVDSDPSVIPDYYGEDVIVLSDNVPCFNEYDVVNITGKHFSELDELGRCGTAYAMLDADMMPGKERESIRDIKPSGWHTYHYEELMGNDYLYNRSHLLAYAMTGENANPKNLITGTRYFNQQTMQDYELIVLRYLDDHDIEKVLYRVSPYFKGDELVARGVEMEAYSVADEGEDVCFHVFVYNIQPGVDIDYKTGKTRLSADWEDYLEYYEAA